jgi:hypothetical protein
MASNQKSQLTRWETALSSINGLSEANRLRESVVDPCTATAEDCWSVIWNKPLYANTYVSTAERQEAAIREDMRGAWRFLGKCSKKFKITHNKPGKAASNFEFEGIMAKKIRNECKIALHRLFAIQGAAEGFRKIVREAGEAIPFKSLAEQPLVKLVPCLKQKFGKGWGHVSVLHVLTDFGLAVKPDLHLVHTISRMELLDDLNESKVPNEKDAVKISKAVAELAKEIYGKGFTPGDLRYLDKVLMEVSRQKLLDG